MEGASPRRVFRALRALLRAASRALRLLPERGERGTAPERTWGERDERMVDGEEARR